MGEGKPPATVHRPPFFVLTLCAVMPTHRRCDSSGPKGDSPPLPAPDTSGIAAAVAAAKGADVAVLFFGSDQTTEAENFDRLSLGLVGAQEQLLAAVTAVQPNVVVVLIHGGPIAVESAVASTQVKAIVDAFQPGELGSDAIMDLLDGTTSPSGLMPYTTYLANFTARDIREVDLTADRGTTYWWHTDPVLYPFGFGLSYSTFTFQWSQHPPAFQSAPPSSGTSLGEATSHNKGSQNGGVGGGGGGGGGSSRQNVTTAAPSADAAHAATTVQLPPSASDLATFAINHSVIVTNTGTTVSDIVALAFVVVAPAPASSPPEMPLRKLFGFERFTAVKPGESRSAYFASTADSLGVVGADGVKRLHPGAYLIEVGSVKQSIAVLKLQLVGTAPLVVEENTWAQTARSQ